MLRVLCISSCPIPNPSGPPRKKKGLVCVRCVLMAGGVEWMTVVVVFCPLVSKLKWLSAPPVLELWMWHWLLLLLVGPVLLYKRE